MRELIKFFTLDLQPIYIKGQGKENRQAGTSHEFMRIATLPIPEFHCIAGNELKAEARSTGFNETLEFWESCTRGTQVM